MKALTFNLQEQHVCYCAEYMSTQQASIYFATESDLRALLKANNYQPTDKIPVTIDPDALLQMHDALGCRGEFLTAGVHAAIKADLLADLLAIAGGADTDMAASAQYVLSQLQQKDAEADADIANKILTGRRFLTQ